MKKFLLAALCLALAFCCAFGVAACTPTPGDIDDPSQPVDPSEPHTHSFGEWVVTIPATCTEEGEEQRTCSCGEKETRTLPARGHNYSGGVCTRCGDELVPTDGSCFTFTALEDGSYAVAWNRTTELPREVVIPWEYNGKPVTQIASSAFEEYDGQMSVTIPDSVTSIGAGAFYDCSGLTSVAIPSSVTSIGMVAFYQCSGLTSIAIPDGVTSIGMGAFLGCSSVTDIFIPAGVTSIEGNVFGNCYALASLNVAEENAVYYSVNNCIIERESKALVVGCKTSVIPSDGSVTSIGDFVFYGCSDLTSVTIPGGVTSIGASAFSDCDGLTSIAIPGGVTSIGEGAFADCDGLTSIAIPGGVTSIGDRAFTDCDGLTSLSIPGSVTSIGEWAFSNCTGLTSIAIGDGVTSIGEYAFYYCLELTSVTFEEPDGWSAGTTAISSEDLSDPATAAEYLANTYEGYIWTRS